MTESFLDFIDRYLLLFSSRDMASFSVVCNNGLLISKVNLGVNNGRKKSLRRDSIGRNSSVGTYSVRNSQHYLLSNKFRSVCYGKGEVTLLGVCVCRMSRYGLSCHSNDGGRRDEQTLLRKIIHTGAKNIFSLRLRPKLRLLTERFKRVLVRSILNDFGMFLRKNIKRLTHGTSISGALGLCYLFLRLTAFPSPKIVPYSDFVTILQNGSVTNVLLEEGSRRIYYNMKSQESESTRDSEEMLEMRMQLKQLQEEVS